MWHLNLKAGNDAFRHLQPSWEPAERWLNLKLDPPSSFKFAGCLPSSQATGIDWRKADGTKDPPVLASASVPIETEPSNFEVRSCRTPSTQPPARRGHQGVVRYPVSVTVYESIILSGIAGTEYALRHSQLAPCSFQYFQYTTGFLN